MSISLAGVRPVVGGRSLDYRGLLNYAGLLGVPAAAIAHADMCNDGALQRGGSGGDYYVCQGNTWTHIVPTFDPNSGDGYGPNQPLPPLCVRFP
jgi:hypothetical protein